MPGKAGFEGEADGEAGGEAGGESCGTHVEVEVDDDARECSGVNGVL